ISGATNPPRNETLVPRISRNLELRVDAQHAREPGLEALRERRLRILATDALVVGPAQFSRLAGHVPGVAARRLRLEDRAKLFDERRALDEHALLAVEPGRARVEVVAADEQRLVVDGETLRVQA